MWCGAIKRDGRECLYKAKYNGRCGFHKEAVAVAVAAPVVENVDEDAMCSICFDPFCSGNADNCVGLPCNHKYHKNCIKPWLERSNTCPMCRRNIPANVRSRLGVRSTSRRGDSGINDLVRLLENVNDHAALLLSISANQRDEIANVLRDYLRITPSDNRIAPLLRIYAR